MAKRRRKALQPALAPSRRHGGWHGLADGLAPKRQVIWEQPGEGGNTKFTHFEIDHFADCVLNGGKPITDGETALKSLQVIWKLYDAERCNFVPDLREFAIPKADIDNYSEYVSRLVRRRLVEPSLPEINGTNSTMRIVGGASNESDFHPARQ